MGDIHHYAWRARHRNQTVYLTKRDAQRFGDWPSLQVRQGHSNSCCLPPTTSRARKPGWQMHFQMLAFFVHSRPRQCLSEQRQAVANYSEYEFSSIRPGKCA
jgi:hypothetical protein